MSSRLLCMSTCEVLDNKADLDFDFDIQSEARPLWMNWWFLERSAGI